MYDLVVFDLDGVLADAASSWVYVHNHFGTNNESSLEEYNLGIIDDHEFMRRDIALWNSAGKDVLYDDIVRVLDTVPLMPGVKQALETIMASGMKTAIVSGGLLPLASRVARETGIEHVLANDLLRSPGGKLIGEGKLLVELRNKKMPFLSVVRKTGAALERTAAVGNSYIDAPMLQEAGLGIAFDPMDDVVVGAADVVVREKDLRHILPFLGL